MLIVELRLTKALLAAANLTEAFLVCRLIQL
jgi:hypothetical protein